MAVNFYAARSAFLNPAFDKAEALALLARCDHEDARFICDVFRDGPAPKTCLEAKTSLLKIPDRRALCFAALLFDREGFLDYDSIPLLQEASRLGDALAQARLAKEYFNRRYCEPLDEDVCSNLLQLSIANGEPEAMFFLAQTKLNFRSVRPEAIDLFRRAGELGHWKACLAFVQEHLHPADPERYAYLGKVLRMPEFARLHKHQKTGRLDYIPLLLNDIRGVVRMFKSDECGNRVIYQIGKLLAGQIDEKNKTFFGVDTNQNSLNHFEQVITSCKFSIGVYENLCELYQEVIFTWGLVARRHGLVKDIRQLIARDVWSKRFEDYHFYSSNRIYAAKKQRLE